jgi:hypothetical protein
VADKTSTFSVNIDGNAADVANKDADALEGLRAKLEASSTSIKAMVGDLRRLRGSSDEVKAAKLQLKAQITAEQDAVSAANLSILKLGGSYEALAMRARAAAAQKAEELKASKLKIKADEAEAKAAQKAAKAKAEASADLSSALKKAGGPLDGLISKFESLMSSEGMAAAGMGLVVGAAAAVVAAVAALGIGLVAGAIAFTKWAIEGANAARTASLTREAFTGSAQQAEYLGQHIDALAKKVPTSKAALQDLSTSLLQSKFSGQTLVDSFNAISQAGAALGDSVGGKLRGILERGILPNGREGRFFVTPAELQGTGIAFADLARGLATSSKMGVEQAKQALLSGRVPLAAGAKALRTAIEERFGKLNAAKMLDLDVMKTKFGESLSSLTKDIKLEPLLEAASKLLNLFDDSTESGAAIKMLVTDLGTGLVAALTKAGPFAEHFFYGILTAAVELETTIYELRNVIKNNLGELPEIKGLDGYETAKTIFTGMAIVVGVLAANLVLLGAVIVAPIVAFAGLIAGGKAAYNAVKDLDWKGIGVAIVSGIVEGLAPAPLVAAIKLLVGAAKSAFTDSAEIQSPSRLFRREARQIPAGAAEGVEDGTPDVEEAISNMASPSAMKGGGGALGGRGAPIALNLTINAQGATEGAVRALSEPSFHAGVLKTIEDALLGVGYPIMQGVP